MKVGLLGLDIDFLVVRYR